MADTIRDTILGNELYSTLAVMAVAILVLILITKGIDSIRGDERPFLKSIGCGLALFIGLSFVVGIVYSSIR